MAFVFNRADHSYWLDGRRLLGVTDVLRATGVADFSGYPIATRAYYLSRGSAVAAALCQIVKGTFDRDYLNDVDFGGFIRAGENFLVQSKCKVLVVEEPLYEPDLGYAGTEDLIIEWRGKLWVPDYKCNKAQKATQIQTAAYKRAIRSLGWTIGYVHAEEEHERMAIELYEDGAFKPRFYDGLENFEDEQIWLSCLAIAGWQMKSNGRLTLPDAA